MKKEKIGLMNEKERQEEMTFKLEFLKMLKTHQRKIQNNEEFDHPSYDDVNTVKYRIHVGCFLQLPHDEEEGTVFLRDVGRIRLKHVDDGTELSIWYIDFMDEMITIKYNQMEQYLLNETVLAMYIT